ncbi:MAG: hypothetical protein NDI73_04900 [Desulfuromonadales bacterium]|nr:hypothetical protein [Desulfuromonadales bacterium]
MNRKRLLLAALAGLLLLSLAYAFWAMPRQEKAPPRAETPRAVAKKPLAGKQEPPPADRLHLGLLAETPQPFPGAGRDIFRFRGGWAPVVEAPTMIAPPVAVVAPPPPPPPPTPEQILQQKVAGFTFLGFLDKGGVKTVFLSSAGDLFLVKAGERFGKGQELLAQEINATELVVRAGEGSETVRVKLVENEALKPTMLTSGGGGGVSGVPGTASGMARPGGGIFPSRRSVLPQRAPLRTAPPAEAENVEQDEPPPNENVTQEEPGKQGLPGGEGNGNTK